MLKTTNIINNLDQIPIEWVFEHYLKLNAKLQGQNLMILSPFNVNDTKPSFGLYKHASGDYKYKDFSTGSHGDFIQLVQNLFNLERAAARNKIIHDYTAWSSRNKGDYDNRENIVVTSYKLSHFEKRQWNKLDANFWGSYHIGSKVLDFFNVIPLSSYKMQRQVNNETEEFEVKGLENIYAYLRADGTVYKIYRPYAKEPRFMTLRDYIQGTDQLTMQKKYLVICSSLKDIMSFTTLGYNAAEAVAPNSENTLIPDHVMNAYRLKYKSIVVLFDNDEAGRKAANIYAEKYNINSVNLLMEKDLSDSVKKHGIETVLKELTPNLKQALNV